MTGGSKTVRLTPLRRVRGVADAIAELRGIFTPGPGAFTGFQQAVPALLGGNPDVARQLYGGQFGFAGRMLECLPANVFGADAPSQAWLDELHGFAWLSHLEAGGLALYRAFARNLVMAWSEQRPASSFDAACERLMALSRHAGFLLSGAPAPFEAQFLHLVSREARRLTQVRIKTPGAALRQSIAVLTAALSFRGSGPLREEALARASAAAASVILPDGGHLDRSPRSLLETICALVPIREALDNLRIAIPRDLNAAIERAIPMLRMLCHGDDGLAVFHGVDHPCTAKVRAVLQRDKVAGRALAHASHSGYARMTQGDCVVILDCGQASICDSALAFEFSDGPNRIAGSCGFPAHATPDWREAARSPAAHSTVEIEDRPGGAVDSFFGRRKIRAAIAPVTARLIASPHGTLVKAESGRHIARLGLRHHRDLFLAASGHDFRGEDRFARADEMEKDWPEARFAIRFHLHPSVKASVDRKGSTILLLLPNKDAWQFSARGGLLSLEDSIYLANAGPPRKCRQIVIRGLAGRPDTVNWAFRKIDKQPRHAESTSQAPRLPF